jgi:pimeloyl-ACP methyl ester carboxylesterase
MPVATAQPRPWWAELGLVVPRALAGAVAASRPHADGTRPSLSPNPLAWGSLAVDELTLSAAYLLSRRRAQDERALDDARSAVAAMTEAGVVDEPRLWFPQAVAPHIAKQSRRRRAGIAFEHLSFCAPFPAPAAVPRAHEWAEVEGNTTAHAYLLRHGDRSRPWVVVLHGHRMGEPRDLRLLGSQRLANTLGVDVAHLVLPMHGPRGRGAVPTFPGLDPLTNLFGMAQSVWDARSLLAALRAEGADTIGVFGISLGGHVAALLAALEPDLRCVIAGVPTSDLATMLERTVRHHWGDDAVAATGVADEAFRTLSRLVSPLSLPVVVPRERRFIYAAVGDRLVTPDQAIALWRHWDRPSILWLQGGHIVNNVGASRRFVVDALTDSGVRCG